MAMHGYIINKQDNNKYPLCNVRLMVDRILWDCKETEAERLRANIQKNIWYKGKYGMKPTYRIRKKNWFLPRHIHNMKEQNKNEIGKNQKEELKKN
jgi:hypothetical protein